MGDERQSKNVISKIDQNYLELDDDVRGIFLFVPVRLDMKNGNYILLPN